MQIECRSPKQIAEDELFQAHTDLTQALAEFVPGSGYLYTGARRDRIKALQKRVADAILDGDTSGTGRTGVSWGMLVYHTIHR